MVVRKEQVIDYKRAILLGQNLSKINVNTGLVV
jgi:hypothetical protein